MSRSIQTTDISASDILGSTSRYADFNIILLGDEHIQTLPTYERTRSYPKSEEDKYYQITMGTQFRPDLVALECYGDPVLWWVIAEANNLFDIEDWIAGKTLRIPPRGVLLSTTEAGVTSTT